MIITISGSVTQKDGDSAIVEAAGIGYQVFMNKKTLGALRVASDVRLWTHEYLREDARELYGFLSSGEHKLFRKLLAVSGVGPKIAMNLLELGTVTEIESLIDRGDLDRLTSVSGVGKKTAQKIVLELKGKLVSGEAGDGEPAEVVAALVHLGYQREKAK